MKKLLIISLLLFGCETDTPISQNDESISLERAVSTNSTNMVLYDVGETMSLTDQNVEFDVCYGNYAQDQLKLSHFNGKISVFGLSATW